MLVLVVSAGGERYALPSRCVVEVVPRVPPRPVALSPGWMSGVIRYRGALLPVIDLVMLLTGKPASMVLSTRLLVVRYEIDGEAQLLGVLAELVTSVVEVDETTAYRGLKIEGAPFLGELIASDGKIVQIVHPEHLLPRAVRELLFSEPPPPANPAMDPDIEASGMLAPVTPTTPTTPVSLTTRVTPRMPETSTTPAPITTPTTTTTPTTLTTPTTTTSPTTPETRATTATTAHAAPTLTATPTIPATPATPATPKEGAS